MVAVITTMIAHAQPIKRFTTSSFNVNDGLLQSTIKDIAYDQNNFCWFSFPNGIQKFDGRSFANVPVQPGLPDDKMVSFFTTINGDLLISHTQGISKYNIQSNSFTQIWTANAGTKTSPLFIGEDEGIIYFYPESANFIGLDSKTFLPVKTIETELPTFLADNFENVPIISKNIVHHKVAFVVNKTLYLWNLKNNTFIKREHLSTVYFPNLFLLNEEEVVSTSLQYPRKNKIYNIVTNTFKEFPLLGNQAYDISVIQPWNNKIIVGFNGRLFAVDSAFKKIEFEFVTFQNKSLSEISAFNRIRVDNYGNLCLTTINDGVRKVMTNNFRIKYYGTGVKQANHVVSVLPDKKNNKVLTGTSGNGVLIFDTLQNLIKHIKYYPGKNEPISVNRITKSNSGNYILYLSSHESVLWLSSDLTKSEAVPLSSTSNDGSLRLGYFGNTLFENEIGNITQSQGYIYKTNFKSRTTNAELLTTYYTMSGLQKNKDLIIHVNDDLIFYDTATLKERKRIYFPNTGYVRSFTKDKNHIFIGTNKGVFKIDTTGKILMHLNKEKGLPDECIYAMLIDKDGFLWCSSNKGVFRINKNHSTFRLNKDDGLQENEFNTNVAAIAEDGELFFGGVNGVSSFFPNTVQNIHDSIKILVKNIRINNNPAFEDTASWNIDRIELPHDQNLFSFDFIAMGAHNPEQYVYQYQMEGIDNQWIENSDMQQVRYFLPPGKYKFKIFASRFFKNDAVPLKVIYIHILPPFWKTWWFIAIISSLFILTLVYAINRYHRKKYLVKLQDLENEKKMQLERERISRDLHDNIGAFANAVLHNAEMLQHQKEEPAKKHIMEDLKTASKEIIVSLRETIWAFKHESYTTEESMLRVKNFIQSVSRYYPNIHFSIIDNSPKDYVLHYSNALDLVRIIQEATTNAIKHASAKKITINSNHIKNSWIITITDDGIGFNETEVKNGNGLENMTKRATESNFKFDVNSNVGTGTEVKLTITITRNKD